MKKQNGNINRQKRKELKEDGLPLFEESNGRNNEESKEISIEAEDKLVDSNIKGNFGDDMVATI